MDRAAAARKPATGFPEKVTAFRDGHGGARPVRPAVSRLRRSRCSASSTRPTRPTTARPARPAGGCWPIGRCRACCATTGRGRSTSSSGGSAKADLGIESFASMTTQSQVDTDALYVELDTERKIRAPQQALLPVQPLADLDLRVLHRARAADVRPVRARLRRRMLAVAGGRAGRDRHRRPARPAARVRAGARTSSGSPRTGRTRSTAASATRRPGAKSSPSRVLNIAGLA